jgi:hypothetical protein
MGGRAVDSYDEVDKTSVASAVRCSADRETL